MHFYFVSTTDFCITGRSICCTQHFYKPTAASLTAFFCIIFFALSCGPLNLASDCYNKHEITLFTARSSSHHSLFRTCIRPVPISAHDNSIATHHCDGLLARITESFPATTTSFDKTHSFVCWYTTFCCIGSSPSDSVSTPMRPEPDPSSLSTHRISNFVLPETSLHLNFYCWIRYLNTFVSHPERIPLKQYERSSFHEQPSIVHTSTFVLCCTSLCGSTHVTYFTCSPKRTTSISLVLCRHLSVALRLNAHHPLEPASPWQWRSAQNCCDFQDQARTCFLCLFW